jgi:formiminoglutamase
MKINSRESESLAPILNESEEFSNTKDIIFTSSSDVGVRRNKGRNGARFAPKAIVNTLKKFNNHTRDQESSIQIIEVASQESESLEFEKSQTESSLKIQNHLQQNTTANIIHIGGGHDHVYPLLLAIEKSEHIKNMLIINIDAHCDTREDSIKHSGTPFRDFSNSSTKPFHLIQYGVQPQANSKTTFKPFKKGTIEYIYLDQVKKKSKNYSTTIEELIISSPFEVDDSTAILISLDCDAIDGSQMQAVSAVNGNGIPLPHIHDLIKQVKAISSTPLYFGIYEFNPVYDNINQVGSRSIASLIYNFLEI